MVVSPRSWVMVRVASADGEALPPSDPEPPPGAHPARPKTSSAEARPENVRLVIELNRVLVT